MSETASNTLDAPAPEYSVECLFRRYYRRVVGFFFREGIALEDAKDLAQEAFLRAHRGRDCFRGEASESTWIFEIARNVLRNSLRDQAALKKSVVMVSLGDLGDGQDDRLLEQFPGDQPSPLGVAIERENRRTLSNAIDELPAHMRQAVKLRLRGGLKYVEIAAGLGISVETVKSMLAQARERLRNAVLEPQEVSFAEGQAVEEKACASKAQARPLTGYEQEVLGLYRKHASTRKVAAELGCSAMWVSKVLKRIPEEQRTALGVTVRPRGFARPWPTG